MVHNPLIRRYFFRGMEHGGGILNFFHANTSWHDCFFLMFFSLCFCFSFGVKVIINRTFLQGHLDVATETTRERSLKNTSWKHKHIRIPVTMLSSAEAELFALIEGLKEGISSSLIVETVLHGLPQMDQTYQYEFQTGTFHVKLLSDSEGVGNIARMTGLLRRVWQVWTSGNIPTGKHRGRQSFGDLYAGSVTQLRTLKYLPYLTIVLCHRMTPVKIDGWKMTCPINMVPLQGFQGTFLSFEGCRSWKEKQSLYRIPTKPPQE